MELTFASSGRFRAASRNFWRLSLSSSTLPPLRSCSQNEKPPVLPMPGIAGGANAKAMASGTRARSDRLMVAWISAELRPAARRSPHGFSSTKKNAVYEAEVRVSRLKPLMVTTPSTPSRSLSIPSIVLVTSSVRWSEAASGSWTFMRRKPWSSSAMNPVGSARPSPPAPTAKPARITSPSAILRMRPWDRST